MQTEKNATYEQVEPDLRGERQRLIDRRNRLRRIDDSEWEKMSLVLAYKLRVYASRDQSMRIFVEAVLWAADNGLSWGMLPREYGPWRADYVRFIRWAERDIWRGIANSLNDSTLRDALIVLSENYLNRKRRKQMISGDESDS